MEGGCNEPVCNEPSVELYTNVIISIDLFGFDTFDGDDNGADDGDGADGNGDDDVKMAGEAFRETIFPGCPMSVGSSAVLLMLKHKLTLTAAADLVNLLVAHFPTEHSFYIDLQVVSVYQFSVLI